MGKIEGRASLEVKRSLVYNLFILRHLFKCIITRLEACKLRKRKKKKNSLSFYKPGERFTPRKVKKAIVFNITKGSNK